ncbi:MAG: methylated-DNA--[protein]-cysteine S-methyltransferase [Clostridiaceae bacterium]
MDKRYYGYYNSPIGVLEIICSEDSLQEISFVNEEKQIENTNLIVKKVVNQLEEYFQGKRKEFDIKMELQGTDFQKQVWNQLIKIPHGKTASYKDVAIKINNEKAVRAVGNANNKNKIPIIIPCHRVIGANGKLVGYDGGLDKKQWLLNHEKNIY